MANFVKDLHTFPGKKNALFGGCWDGWLQAWFRSFVERSSKIIIAEGSFGTGLPKGLVLFRNTAFSRGYSTCLQKANLQSVFF